MPEETRALLLTLRDQASKHASDAASAVDVANNREQHILLTANAISAAYLVTAIDIALEP